MVLRIGERKDELQIHGEKMREKKQKEGRKAGRKGGREWEGGKEEGWEVKITGTKKRNGCEMSN